MESLIKLTDKIKIEHKIKSLEKEIVSGLCNIISDIHEYNISCHFDLNDKDETDEIFYPKFLMIFGIIQNRFEYRLKCLKSELIKKFEIEQNDESESESESEPKI